MKKSVLLIISLIYVLAVVLVGTNLQLKVYDPIVYAEKIEVLNEDYQIYTDEDRISDYDGHINLKYTEGLSVELKCRVFPYDATTTTLTYIFDKDLQIAHAQETTDNFLKVDFKKSGGFPVTVRADDGSGIELKVFIFAKGRRPI